MTGGPPETISRFSPWRRAEGTRCVSLFGPSGWTAGILLCLTLALSAADWRYFEHGRWSELSVPAASGPGFTRIDGPASGILFTNSCAQDRHLTNQILLNGSGVAAGDVDGDGRCDLYFCGLDGDNALFRNLGDWRFENITAAAGVRCAGVDATAAAFADLDGDADLDLIVNSVGQGTRIFLNDGQARFTEATPRLNEKLGGMSMALADIEGDGDLDLYIANYRTVTLRDQPNTRFSIKVIDGKPTVVAVDGRSVNEPDLAHRFNYKISMGEKGGTFAHEENGEPDVLYRNEGGRFVAVSFTAGAFLDEDGRRLSLPPFDWGLSVMFRDINGDHAPDIYVCNDFKSPDRIWINDGRGNFRAIPRLALRQSCLSSMGVDFADLNRDGFDDFIVVDMLSRIHFHRFSQRIDIKPEPLEVGQIDNRPQYPRNMLYLSRGDGTYAEAAQLSGLEATEWSWTPIFLDVDLDGYEDLLVSNGFERDGMNVDTLIHLERLKKEQNLPPIEQLRLRKMFPRLATGNLAFRNAGNLKFQDKSADWRFDEKVITHGMALADLDGDGDLDVAMNNFNAPAGIYRNDAVTHRVAVRLKGEGANTRGIGAKIKVLGGPVTQTQEIGCGGRYLSSDDAIRCFAAGAGEMTIEVTWRTGKSTTVTGVRANRMYEIAEANAVEPLNREPLNRSNDSTIQRFNDSTNALFTDASDLIQHRHVETPFNDFGVQPLLPMRLSQLGPGVSWFDVDRDGFDDILIGSGKGGTMGVFLNDRKGGFRKQTQGVFSQPVARDQTTVLGGHSGNGQVTFLAGSANDEDGSPTSGAVREYDLSSATVTDSIPGQSSSTGPLAMADVDGDGDLDLFVGGRVVPGRYPQPASSMILRRSAAGWSKDEENSRVFEHAGLVSGAVFSDLDADGDPDLLLACHWGPVRVFRNAGGRFAEATAELKLDGLRGWWNGVATGDFDNDGRLDIVASNWGRNTKYESFMPVEMFYGDLDGNEVIDTFEAYQTGAGRQPPLPLQPFHMVGAALPMLRERIGSFEKYARSTLPDICGDRFNDLRRLEANALDSMLFLNRGSRFDAVPLPIEAQLAPAFAICVADFDGDGNEDAFLSQNFFAVHPETSRYDSGRGLLLKGDGRGGLRAVPAQESGIAVYGEQRGAAASDYDADGRTDLVVTQNGAQTRLFRNSGAKPGLRVRLAGPADNQDAVGAAIRLGDQNRLGPAREVRVGSGYWSQDSTVQVFGGESRERIFVRWPGGKETTSALPPTAKEVVVQRSGEVKLAR